MSCPGFTESRAKLEAGQAVSPSHPLWTPGSSCRGDAHVGVHLEDEALCWTSHSVAFSPGRSWPRHLGKSRQTSRHGEGEFSQGWAHAEWLSHFFVEKPWSLPLCPSSRLRSWPYMGPAVVFLSCGRSLLHQQDVSLSPHLSSCHHSIKGRCD